MLLEDTEGVEESENKIINKLIQERVPHMGENSHQLRTLARKQGHTKLGMIIR